MFAAQTGMVENFPRFFQVLFAKRKCGLSQDLQLYRQHIHRFFYLILWLDCLKLRWIVLCCLCDGESLISVD